jgi:tetratricopeptide (TPR) repeat protein
MKINLEQALQDLDAMRQMDSDEGVANALFTVAVAYLDRGKADDAWEALDEAGYLCRKLENEPGLAQVNLRLGEVELVRGNLPLAEESLRAALDFFVAQDDAPGRTGALERLGRVLIEGRRLAEAARVYEEALELCLAGNDDVGEVLMTQYLAALYRNLDRREEAVVAYDNLRRAAEALGDRQRVALALVGVGTCLVELGKVQPGLEAMAQAAQEYADLGQMTLAEQVRAEMERLSHLYETT